MNISDATVGRTAEMSVAAQERISPPRENIREKQNTDIKQPVRGDEYIPTPKVNISNALYDVHDVAGGASVIVSAAPTRNVSSSGETVGRKIVEFLLPTGRKSLAIYSMDVQKLSGRE